MRGTGSESPCGTQAVAPDERTMPSEPDTAIGGGALVGLANLTRYGLHENPGIVNSNCN